MDKRRIKSEYLNRRDFDAERVAQLRVEGDVNFSALIDLLENDSLTGRQTINGMIYLFSLRRVPEVAEGDLQKYADLLIRLTGSPQAKVRERANLLISTVVTEIASGATSVFDDVSLERFRNLANVES